MTIAELIAMCGRRITNLQAQRSSAAALGDIKQVERIDEEISEMQSTLNSLRTLE